MQALDLSLTKIKDNCLMKMVSFVLLTVKENLRIKTGKEFFKS
uniref:Uncharacterized protein n=1 Tax=Nelumbo nucifera TaxID=4432 RepID=A0A822Z8W5_NELNU|nr:TPA_asm: hypothetical protein HUJ06_015620 [Nelumbo nucifera]